MKTNHTITDSKGRTFKRTSQSHVYTHAVVVDFLGEGPSEWWPEGIPPETRTEWASRRDLAEKVASKYQAKKNNDGTDRYVVEIVEVGSN